VARETLGTVKPGLVKRSLRFLRDSFVKKKLNNWVGYTFIILVAIVMGGLSGTNLIAGIGLFGALAAFCILVAFLTRPEFGFFVLMGFCFYVAFFNNLFFGGDLQVGVFYDIMVLLIFLGVIAQTGEFKGNWKRFIHYSLVSYILMTLCYNVVQVFNPNSRPSSTDILAIRKFVGYILLLFSAYHLFSNYQRVRRYIFALFFIALICAFYGCIQEWHGLFNFELEPIMADPHAFGLLFANGEFRKFSTMSDPTTFGILMAVSAIFFLILSSQEEDKRVKYLFIFGSVFMILGMLYSGTRTANATLVAGVAFFILLNIEKQATRIFGAVAIVVFLAILYGPFSSVPFVNRFRTTFQGSKDESYKVRILSRAWIQPYILSHPIGGGMGTTGFNGAIEHPGHPLANFQPDSSYVKRAAETGWIGLAIVCILYAFTLIEAVRAYFRAKDEKRKVLYAACASSLFAFYIAEFAQVAIGGTSDVVVYYPIVAIVLRSKIFEADEQTGISV